MEQGRGGRDEARGGQGEEERGEGAEVAEGAAEFVQRAGQQGVGVVDVDGAEVGVEGAEGSGERHFGGWCRKRQRLGGRMSRYWKGLAGLKTLYLCRLQQSVVDNVQISQDVGVVRPPDLSSL